MSWLVAWLLRCLAGWLFGWLVGWGTRKEEGGRRTRARGRAQGGKGQTLYKKKSGVQTPDRPKAVMLNYQDFLVN